ncbi:MAG: SUMF1/EgtB/PvdO family nonheme iron enzyme [Gomphosphaeria aponina SAG 52.96 = DSM 107014]|uniref:non-specific serine/threonine protein kinase n=1 Tax=Gomphosphaeria aponina SAG 52.96 = DSM 107014 TaxID=1521640 RepID=A0A941GRL0_9CHRO|nr:SUMF1/EgtB/PvdO family nonheme iron enzyme [Gomphosphaeria aponina SAG 52.96 = DSM 107014]
MVYCLNPACPTPENPDHNKFCQGCRSELASSTKSYIFRHRFRVEKKLGEGAFGRTYKALDLDFRDKPRVIKKFIAQVQGGALEKAKELFEREGEQLEKLDHPQIPKIHAFFTEANSLYLVQDFVDGDNLYNEFEKYGRFSEQKIRQILEELLPVLGYLHKHKVLHRDIKPDNIMRSHKNNTLVLIDFGGAKQQTGTMQASPGTILYTPGYAAMEHMHGRPCEASDIYSLGATCVRLMTGCFPTYDRAGNTIDEVYNAIKGRWRWQEILDQRGIKINPVLEKVLEKMLAQYAYERFQTTKETLAALNPPRVARRPPTQTPAPPQPTYILKPIPPAKTISRGEFLKLAGWGGAGVIGTMIIGSLLSKLQLNRTFNFDVITVNSKGEEIKRENKQAQYFSANIGNGITIDFVSIPGGTFLMGSPADEEERLDSESPQHQVTVSPFFMGKYQVTQAQYEAVMGDNPSSFKGPNRPVENVSWHDCVKFCEKLSQNLKKDVRLASEAEWEYACRAQTQTVTPFHFGETLTTDLANYDGNYTYGSGPEGVYREETTDVGSFPPNAFGLYDMHGNVREWCADNWHENYQNAPNNGSVWTGGDETYSCAARW